MITDSYTYTGNIVPISTWADSTTTGYSTVSSIYYNKYKKIYIDKRFTDTTCTGNSYWIDYSTTVTSTNYEWCRDISWDWPNKQFYTIPANPSSRIREIMRSRVAPAFHVRGNPLKQGDHREAAARSTLRRVIGEDKFRKFLRCGHVSVRAKSGLVYQIFPGHDMTKVYRDGVFTEKLCVVLKGNFPPTDSLIMRYLLILNDEADFRSHAISHSINNATIRVPLVEEPRRLIDIFSELKGKRAVA